ncbi:aspartic proteinase cdr1 [Phtheirospermum japonicum]|uniref:Aspartic proteinase cdr1 n=1 Tax=Phtheirospermum japonicum TaxID=374723 RepID=A0A830BP21_9LAMI|nr:aspartic proteinase cdr1 [Phtheirospermum japonicum]
MILKSVFLIAYVSLISLVSISKSDSLTEGFTSTLIHRDSPQSPTYDPTLSPTQRLANAIRRSSHRIQRFNDKLSQQFPVSDITNSGGEYLMKYSIGMPPVPSLGIADTGSDIIWTQCKPCLKCFNQTLPFFSPRKSSTYKTIPCNTTRCDSLIETSCSRTRRNCLYTETYGDGSSTYGLLANETITLPSTSNNGGGVSLPNITFGCGFQNGGLFGGGESGIVGLGGGNVSLIRQLGPLAQGKFSYCLVPLSSGGSSPSRLNFGANAVVSGNGVVSTPLVRKQPDTFYFLTLEGITVGNKRLDYYDGNVIIDSGTTLTLLPFHLYGRVEKELNGSISLKRIKDPINALELCYATRKDDIEHPPVTFHFTDADVKLKTENIFVRTSNVSLCFAAQPVLLGFGIYGNLAQINYLVGYDLEKRSVSFRPTQCGGK